MSVKRLINLRYPFEWRSLMINYQYSLSIIKLFIKIDQQQRFIFFWCWKARLWTKLLIYQVLSSISVVEMIMQWRIGEILRLEGRMCVFMLGHMDIDAQWTANLLRCVGVRCAYCNNLILLLYKYIVIDTASYHIWESEIR